MDPRPYGESYVKPPKDGPGPRGGRECYHMSRTRLSTARYADFVKKLRVVEEVQRKGKENALKEMKDTQISDFFNICDQRSMLNNVAHRVELCMASYQLDLKKKRQRLAELLQNEEEYNVRKFVEMAQSGAAAVWQDKKDRLAFLVAKRKKEHEEKFKVVPLSACVQFHPLVIGFQSKEAEKIQLYQMRVKEAQKQAQKEFDKMWYAVALKESEALAARLEYDTIVNLRRTRDIQKEADKVLQQHRIDEQKERERLRLETLYFRNLWAENNKKEDDENRAAAEKRQQTTRERKEAVAQRQEILARAAVVNKRVNDAWDQLTAQGSSDESAMRDRARRMEQETNLCNFKLLDLRQERLDSQSANDHLVSEMSAEDQAKLDNKRCNYLNWSKKTNKEVRVFMKEQIKDRQKAKEERHRLILEEVQCRSDMDEQIEALARHKDANEAQTNRQHGQNVLQQIEHNKLLKERALQEERDQIKKFQLAEAKYQQETKNMLGRPFFSNYQHAFMKQLSKGLKMKEKCPCSKPDYCAE